MRHNIWVFGAILMFSQPVTVYEKIKFNPTKWYVCDLKKVGQYHELHRQIPLDGVLMAYTMVKKWQIYLKLF